MGGGLIQLVAYGSQDVHLTGNPQITFWKVIYRRHTNFALESIEQVINGVASDNANMVSTISRNGDLIHKCYIVFDIPKGKVCSSIKDAHNLIESVELEIGGQVIDKQYGDWMTIWNELTLSEDKRYGYTNMVTNQSLLNDGKIYIPLQFYFCSIPGLSLPLIALQYHEIRIKIKLGSTINTVCGDSPNVKLWVDYVYLDSDERRKMAQSEHEFLITQLQVDAGTNMSSKTDQFCEKTTRLNFNHPIKELIWVIDNKKLGTCGDLFNITQDRVHKVTMNGHDRAVPREGRYFSHVQPYQHHTRIPYGKFKSKINVYSFALKPEDFQPSGTCNFSRIDHAELTTKVDLLNQNNRAWLKVFATNWNILRISNGMGGLAYSN